RGTVRDTAEPEMSGRSLHVVAGPRSLLSQVGSWAGSFPRSRDATHSVRDRELPVVVANRRAGQSRAGIEHRLSGSVQPVDAVHALALLPTHQTSGAPLDHRRVDHAGRHAVHLRKLLLRRPPLAGLPHASSDLLADVVDDPRTKRLVGHSDTPRLARQVDHPPDPVANVTRLAWVTSVT